MNYEIPRGFILLCAEACPFGRRCAEKYFDESQVWEGSCAEKITEAIKTQVSPYHSEASADGDKLLFTTSKPDRRVEVFDGQLIIKKI